MQKGLGIAALVIAIISMFVPFVGTWLTVLAGLLAAFAYGPGIGLAIASIVINVVHIFFFSPLLWVTQGMAEAGAVMGEELSKSQGKAVDIDFVFLPWILVAAQIGAGVLLYVLHSKQSKRVVIPAN